MHRRLLTLALAAAAVAAPAFAQQSQPAPAQPAATTHAANPATVNGHRYNQQQHIANGVQSGQLTAGETRRLENREANVNREVRADRTANGGRLTPQERQQINHQQSNLNHSIYNDKHNANQAHYGNNQVGQRRENQQNRIANGIRNGSMTPGEAARAENRQQSINRQVGADRAANGGRLTPQERGQINRRQNNASRQIYRDKHNGNRAPR